MKKKKRLPLGYYYDVKRNQYKCSFTFKSKRYYVYAKTLDICEEKKAAKLELLKNHMNLDNQTITLGKFFELWIDEKALTVKPATIYAYQKAWRPLEKVFGKLKVVDVEKTHAVQFRKDAVAAGRPADAINKGIKLLKQLLNAAVDERIISYNPCAKISYLKSEKPKATDTIHRALTHEETALFLKYAVQSRYYYLFLFLLNTGCRIGEACALTWFDVNFSKHEINICRTTSRTSDKGFEINSPKTESSNRTIPLKEELAEILEQQKENNAMLFGRSNSLVFPNRCGNITNYNNVNVVIAGIVKNINDAGTPFRSFSVHAFRDTYATRCHEQGMQPNDVKELLGHKHISTTMDKYVQPSKEHLRQETAKMRFVV